MFSDKEQIEMRIRRFQPHQDGDNGAEDEHFEDMLEEHVPKPLRRGEIIEGEILKLEDNLAIIDVGAKRDAIVPPEEMEEVDEGFLEALDEGDNVYVYVTRTPFGDEELLVSLEKGLREQDWQRATDYLENQEVLELKIVGKNKGGLLVEFGRLRGFIPNSHVPILVNIHDRQERMQQKSKMIDQTVPVKVLEVDRKRRRLVLSAKAAREELLAERMAKLEEGQIVVGRVVHLVDYGAFVDLGGVTGLLHVSEMDWSHVDNPADIFEIGEEIELFITEVDPERERVSLSRKELIPNPWEQFAQRYEESDLIEGEVTALVDFGAFIQLPFEIEGLVHISEMHIPGSGTPEDVLQPGEKLLLRIISIEPEEERIGLSMRQVSTTEEIAWLSSQEESQEQDRDVNLEADQSSQEESQEEGQLSSNIV
jgi:small subunit ribosomal protein S1